MASRAGRNDPAPPIIVKKVTVVADAGHHGGAWKVAYADFVTAMMAFFLLLWLLGSTTEDERKGLADYFTPTLVKTKEQSAGSHGLLGGSSLTDTDNYPHRAGQTATRAITVPRDAKGGPKESISTAKRMSARVAEKLKNDERLRRLMKQVRMIDTTEGVRIDLVDDADPFMIMLNPNDMRRRELIFNAYQIPEIGKHFVNIAIATVGTRWITLDGNPITSSFTPFASDPDYSWATIEVRGGTHRIYSPVGCIPYVYGFGEAESYGYSTGAVDIPCRAPLVRSSSVTCFDTVSTT